MKPHPTDRVSLGFGLAFLGAGALWLVSRVVALDAASVAWLVAGGLVLLGAAGLIQVTVTANRRHAPERHDDPPA